MSHILVVDDDRSTRRLLCELLQRAGYSVTPAEDGEEALKTLESGSFDLMLMDVWMPRMTGLDVLERLRGRPAKPPIIMMTADNTPETVLRAVRDQAYQYITKPFESAHVLEAVANALAAARATPPIEVVSATPQWVELLVPCDRAVADRIQSFLGLLKADLDDEVRESVGQAFREMLLNAIEWGGQLDPQSRVRISYLRARRMLLYRIADPGSGFRFAGLSHAAIANPPENPIEHIAERDRLGLRPGGFGILLTQARVDELIYNEKQNEVVLIKYLD